MAIIDIKKRMWQLEDRNRGKQVVNWPDRDKDEYRTLQHELEQKQKEFKTMGDKR